MRGMAQLLRRLPGLLMDKIALPMMPASTQQEDMNPGITFSSSGTNRNVCG